MASYKLSFWNVENLFDHQRASRDPDLWNKIKDELKNWTAEVRDKKIQRLGEVLRALDSHLIGLSEVENEHVLKMLAKRGGRLPISDSSSWRKDRYQVVGHPSPDKRGIDVCFLYDQSKLRVLEGGFHAVAIGYPTRDLVWARFETLAESESFIAIVSHWPSRANTSSSREKVGEEVRKLIQFLQRAYGSKMPIVVMGDYNDGPKNKSVWVSLRARDRNAAWADSSGKTLFNATAKATTPKIKGTHWYKGKWSTLDHITVNRRMLQPSSPVELIEGSGEIFAPDWVRKSNGQPRRFGRPKINTDTNGYSDHFAVSIDISVSGN